MFLISLCILFLCSNAFFFNLLKKNNSPSLKTIQIGFLHGSKIPNEYYKPFFDDLKDRFDNPVNITYYSYFPFTDIINNTILIGHSFGGTIALLYCIKDNIQEINHIKSCILINSHFNHRNKMPYPGIKMHSISQPVLTFLGRNDEKLPYKKAIDDYEVARMKNYTNKTFLINNGNHTSCFINPDEMDCMTEQVAIHIRKILSVDNYMF